jgi:hypothetical protein
VEGRRTLDSDDRHHPAPLSFRQSLISVDVDVLDTLSIGTAEFGIGTSIAHAQIANRIVDHITEDPMDLVQALSQSLGRSRDVNAACQPQRA